MNCPKYLKRIKRKMRKEPDLLEQGFWTIFGIILAISIVYTTEMIVVITIGAILVLLVTATIFWSYAKRLEQ